jgi:hypothetical protein
MSKYKITITSNLGQTQFFIRAATLETAISKSTDIAEPKPGDKLTFQIFNDSGREVYSKDISTYNDEAVWQHIRTYEEEKRKDEKIRKMILIKNWIRDNVKRNPPVVQLNDIKPVGSTVIDDKYIFFFNGTGQEIHLQSVLKRKRMDRAATWMINGRASKNTKQMYWNA